MKLFIHKLDTIIDVYDDNTLSQEIVCFVKAITSVSVSCPFEQIVIVGKHSVVLQQHNDGTPFVVGITMKEMLQRVIKIDCNDIWLLWGGWLELVNDFDLQTAKQFVDLHNMWSTALCAKFALCTDMRFPFKDVAYLNAGRIDFVRPGFPPVLELTQCLYKTKTVFDAVAFLPLFLMPTCGVNLLKPTNIANKQCDLIYATRDWHMLSTSRRHKIANYYVQDGIKSVFMGQHDHVQAFYKCMTEQQKSCIDNTCKFEHAATFYEVPRRMSTAIANVAIGDAQYEKHGLIPNRVGEGIAAGIITFVDNAIDEKHVLFGDNKALSNLSYVATPQDVAYRLQVFKQQPELYAHYVEQQRTWLLQHWDLGKHFYAATYAFMTQHRNMHICDACPSHL